MPVNMNRIKEVREGAGISASELARRINTSPQQVARLESEERRLTIKWLQRIAVALDCTIAELLLPPLEGLTDEVEDVEASSIPEVVSALQGRLGVYRVLSDSLFNLGIASQSQNGSRRNIISVDEQVTDFKSLRTGDVVLVRLTFEDRSVRVLREFIAPGMLTTNKRGANSSILLDDEFVTLDLIGRVYT